MKNRFQFHDEEIGRTIHCVIVDVPRKDAKVACISKGGKFYRVPVNLLKHVPENSPIDDIQADELIKRGVAHLKKKRMHAINLRIQREEINRQLSVALGFDLDKAIAEIFK